MKQVKPKKNLGQHFLTDLDVARRIADTVDACPALPILEIGPGMGVLTQYLVKKNREVKAVEIDSESVAYLNERYPELRDQIIGEDFLRMDLNKIFNGRQFVLTGNYPYDISSQIFFKMLDYKDLIPCCTGMIQREVAQRIASAPGNKAYGILSVMIQAWYDVEYLFTVDEGVFNPPPKVKSAVIRMTRNNVTHDTQQRDGSRLRRGALQACGEDRLRPAPQDVACLVAPALHAADDALTRLLRSGHHDETSRTALCSAIRGTHLHGCGQSKQQRSVKAKVRT